MKAYLISLGAGLLVGIVYSLLNVRSPAPPVIALVGLAGILLGEQVIPFARHMADRRPAAEFVRHHASAHILGQLPSARSAPVDPDRAASAAGTDRA